MNITILNVTIETKPTTKGSYQVADVAYKNNSFQGKVEGKKVMSFGATAEAFKVLATAQSGDTFEVNVVKNDKGYNDWVSMQKAGAQAPVANSSAGNAQGVQRGGSPAPASRGFETPEERAKKQVYIIRQSSIGHAVAALAVGSKSKLNAAEVIEEARKYEAFVLGTEPNLTGFDDVPSFDPTFDNQPQID